MSLSACPPPPQASAPEAPARIDPPATPSQVKKIPIAALRPGMYICDFNAGWMSHPFLFNRLHVRSELEIAEIAAHGIEAVFIDTRKGIDVADAPTRAAVAAANREEMLDHMARPSPSNLPPEMPEEPPQPGTSSQATSAEEIRRARQVLNQAADRLRQVMEDVRLGKSIDIPALQDSVQQISAAVIRNSSAMTLVCRLRQRDAYTFDHSLNVGVLLARFSHFLGHDLPQTHAIALGGLLHDIGKMSVATEILQKPGKLTADEYAHMKTHVERGLALVAPYGLPAASLKVIAEHHERCDGSGYPDGHPGSALSEAGRMAAIVDVYDAISSDRVYHRGLPAPEAMGRIFEWQRHFDVPLVSQFVRCLGIYPIASLVRLKSDRLAIVIQHHPEKLVRPRVRVIFHAGRRAHLPPEDIDLAAPHWHVREAIVGHEDPVAWGIDVSHYLMA
jgi:putative nucleotidyltransferase with HDIG domain